MNFGHQYISSYLSYEQNLWTQSGQLNDYNSPGGYENAFILNIFGQLYFLRPNSETYIYDINVQKWKVTGSIVNSNILENSEKISIIRLHKKVY